MARLNALDAAFLDTEDGDRHASLAIASIAVIAGPPPDQAEFTAAVTARVRAIPRARQRVLRVPFDLGRPVWADDPHFDPAYNIRRTALPRHDPDALRRLVGRIMSQRLDRDRPLWEIWVIEGLSQNRWAVLTKVHHCLADGISGLRLQTVIFGDQPLSVVDDPATPLPGPGRLLLSALADLAASPADQLRLAVAALRSPARLVERLATTARGLAGLAGVLNPASTSSLSGPIGRYCRYETATVALSDVVEIGRTFGATVNDVILTAISGAFRMLLTDRGERPDAAAVRTLLPVSVRAAGAEGVPDNRVSLLLPVLPVDIADPVEALLVVHDRLTTAKAGGAAEAGVSITTLAGHEPFPPVSLAIRLLSRLPQRSVVTVTTNVPGPRDPLTVFGHEVVELLPYVPIAIRFRIGVAALSYRDTVTFGITGDYDGAPELAGFARAVEQRVTALLAAARA